MKKSTAKRRAARWRPGPGLADNPPAAGFAKGRALRRLTTAINAARAFAAAHGRPKLTLCGALIASGIIAPAGPLLAAQPASDPLLHTVWRFQAPSSSHMDVQVDMQARHERGGRRLVLDCSLREKQGPAALTRLSQELYRELNGKGYDQITINWRLDGDGPRAEPWAASYMTGDTSVTRLLLPDAFGHAQP